MLATVDLDPLNQAFGLIHAHMNHNICELYSSPLSCAVKDGREILSVATFYNDCTVMKGKSEYKVHQLLTTMIGTLRCA